MADCTKTISTALESRPNRFIGTDVVSKKTCSNCCVDDFYSSVKVWIERPQVVNKRLMGAILEDCREEEEGHSGDWVHMKRKLLPKQSDVRPGTEHVTVTDSKHSVTFQTELDFSVAITDGSTQSTFSYQISYSPMEQCINLKVPNWLLLATKDWSPNKTTVPSIQWLSDILIPKLVQWANESSENGNRDEPKRMTLVSLDGYTSNYLRMKQKYGTHLVKNWTEATDPYKHVYEDISIAAYLLSLWADERERLGIESHQSFVDLGCGNGLLTHLLTMEGYPGKGIDLRKRKIWKLFQPETKLEETSVTPSDAHLFPDYDWLLGNHSDELTPWIPLMAARSSYTTKYFVIPCCPHDFVGKFARNKHGMSQYRSYLEYISEIGKAVGFKVQRDVLRIPSSKRVCFIGSERYYAIDEEDRIEDLRKKFLSERCQLKVASKIENEENPEIKTQGLASSEVWCEEFKPRPVSSQRRPAQNNQELVTHIVSTVAEKLLGQPLGNKSKPQACTSDHWTTGGNTMTLEEAASLFDNVTLQRLKQQYGGMQTLLRNQHQVFRVQYGRVSIRDWSSRLESEVSRKPAKKRPKKPARMFHKSKLCWFELHHPQGCPLSTRDCTYAHSKEELKERPQFDIEPHKQMDTYS